MSSESPSKPWASVVELFQRRVAAAPDSVAVVDVDGARLSYRDVNRRANRLAHELRARGVGPEVRVALVLPRSAQIVVAVLAVLKAGGTYVPVDPENSDHRIGHVFTNALPVLALTTAELAHRLPAGMPHLLVDGAELAGRPDDDPPSRILPDHAQYVIYTSGSTGTPKGVVVSHRNVAWLFAATAETYDFGPSDAWTLFHSYSFDFSVWELWGALCHGGRLVIVSKETARDTPAFLDLLVRARVTMLNLTPAVLAQLMQADRERPTNGLALRYVFVGGEPVEPASLVDWYRRHPDDAPVVVIVYGVTETTVLTTFRPVDAEFAMGGSGNCIGDAIPDGPVYVLDDDLCPVATGVRGELCIGGAGVTRGYLGRPALTAQRFLPDPFGAPGARMYRSGDLARRSAAGELEFLGRADSQVKIRGFRIELGEIEVVIGECPQVGQVAVTIREDRPGDRRIVAYVVPAMDTAKATLPPEVQRWGADRLPHYMVPAAVVAMDVLPLTVNGKLDRAALPAPVLAPTDAPVTATERAVASVWAELLEYDAVGRADHYLELGGHSLLAARIVARVRAELSVDVQVRDLYDHPVLADFARRVEELGARGSSVPPPIRRIARTASVGER